MSEELPAMWARVELMGRRQRHGLCTEVDVVGVRMLRIEIPTTPPAVEFYPGQAIYGIRLMTEEQCRAASAPTPAYELLPGNDEYEDDF